MKFTPPAMIAALVVVSTGTFVVGRATAPGGSGSATSDATSTAERQSRASGLSSASGGRARPTRESRANSSRNAEIGQGSLEERIAARSKEVESIIRGENALARGKAMLDLIDSLSPEEFEGVVANFRNLGMTEQRFGEYGMLLSAWADIDPVAALAYTRENTNGSFATNTVLSSWATKDPEAAIRWADSNHTGDGANPLMVGVIRGIAGNDPFRATDLLTSMPRSGERGEALNVMLPHILQQGPEAARDWISGISDDSLREGAMMRSATDLAREDPRATADWLASNPGNAANRRMDDVIEVWARTDQTAATSYFNSLPAGDQRSNALRGVVSAMTSQDPKAAAAMIDRYPADANDAVYRNFAWRSFGEEPALAAEYIGKIDNAGQRDELYRRTLENWIRKDQAAAMSWLRVNPVSENVQQRIANQLEEMENR